jgi:hypothetical protein
MAFDDKLAARIRQQLGQRRDVIEKKMFGGVAFLLNGNMACGVHGQEMIVRLDPAQTAKALSRPYTRTFDLTGRPMKGWILVEPKGLTTRDALSKWIQVGVKYAASLPPK